MDNERTSELEGDQLPVDHPVEESGGHQQSEGCQNPTQRARFHVPSLVTLAAGFFAGVGDVITVGGGSGHN